MLTRAFCLGVGLAALLGLALAVWGQGLAPGGVAPPVPDPRTWGPAEHHFAPPRRWVPYPSGECGADVWYWRRADGAPDRVVILDRPCPDERRGRE